MTPTQRYLQGEMQRRRANVPQDVAVEVLGPAAAETGLRAGLRNAGSNQYVQKLANLVQGNKGKLVGAGTLLSVLAGAAELADQDDPLTKNIAEGVGITGGSMAGATAGAMIGGLVGGPLAPVTAAIGGLIGGTMGGGVGKGTMGGLYSLVTGESDADRQLRDQAKAARLQTQLDVESAKAMTPIVADQMRVKLADDIQRMERDLAIRNEYNFANTLNTSLLNAQNNHAAQQALLTQMMLG